MGANYKHGAEALNKRKYPQIHQNLYYVTEVQYEQLLTF